MRKFFRRLMDRFAGACMGFGIGYFMGQGGASVEQVRETIHTVCHHVMQPWAKRELPKTPAAS